MPNILANSCWSCPAGSYCVGDHISTTPCPAGFYCPNGTGYNWQPCPPGTFSNQEGLQNSFCKFWVEITVVLGHIAVID